jgi:NodT family efflux transporter outer membrane factor (OMF) lipoprotein
MKRDQGKEKSNKKQQHNRIMFISMVVGIGFIFQGCTVGPDYLTPDVVTPDAWHEQAVQGLSTGQANLQTWWTYFDDPVLSELINKTEQNNLDLKIASSRIMEARAFRGFAHGEYYPDIDGKGAYSRSRSSKDLTPTIPSGFDREEDFNQYGFDATWEIDVWGRIKRSVEAADAGMAASIENYRDLLTILNADVALNYIELRTLQTRLSYAQKNLGLQQDTLKLAQDRVKAQIAPELDTWQAELNLARTESLIPLLEQLITTTIYRLGVLLGEPPQVLYDMLIKSAPLPKLPETIALGIPADLLRQRPDVRRAERELAAQTAQIGVATADLYPRFSLSGEFAYETTKIERTLNSGNLAFAFGPSFRWNIFDGDRIRNLIYVEEERTQQALTRYEQTVLLALEETQGSLVAYHQEQKRSDSLNKSVTAANESVKLVETLYKAGLTDFQNVLDMQQILFIQQDELAASDGAVIQNLIRVYKALGGGWSPVENDLATASKAN